VPREGRWEILQKETKVAKRLREAEDGERKADFCWIGRRRSRSDAPYLGEVKSSKKLMAGVDRWVEVWNILLNR
jgi:hypothetical protein